MSRKAYNTFTNFMQYYCIGMIVYQIYSTLSPEFNYPISATISFTAIAIFMFYIMRKLGK